MSRSEKIASERANSSYPEQFDKYMASGMNFKNQDIQDAIGRVGRSTVDSVWDANPGARAAADQYKAEHDARVARLRQMRIDAGMDPDRAPGIDGNVPKVQPDPNTGTIGGPTAPPGTTPPPVTTPPPATTPPVVAPPATTPPVTPPASESLNTGNGAAPNLNIPDTTGGNFAAASQAQDWIEALRLSNPMLYRQMQISGQI
jgi:hypothetical protein